MCNLPIKNKKKYNYLMTCAIIEIINQNTKSSQIKNKKLINCRGITLFPNLGIFLQLKFVSQGKGIW